MGAEAQAPAAEPVSAELLSQGEALFAGNCKSCHGSTGGGFVGPKLVGNQRLANAEFVLRQITKG
ncbi:c-type cytochrome [Devosia rhizoryzae]|uniref:C-type cytochrome n=1 Tax=Devosia rhizoryzae TaxID=2774137 RepID=A0ABX7C1J9_9HYPH|nr:c-type cytochrome [Devosia rhizoryzae]QQR38063.1 c-type cytochrome [Devosia rhizoryzae]